MIIPPVGQANTVVKVDETGKIQANETTGKEGETLLSFIREIRQILENPAIQNLIKTKIPQQEQQQQEQQQQTGKKETGFDETAIMEMLMTKEGCIKFANGIQMVIDHFGDKKLSEFKQMILEQFGDTERVEFKEVKENEVKSD